MTGNTSAMSHTTLSFRSALRTPSLAGRRRLCASLRTIPKMVVTQYRDTNISNTPFEPTRHLSQDWLVGL